MAASQLRLRRAPGPRSQFTGPSSVTITGTGNPHTLQAALVGLTPGFCYLCTMSLISFTELRSLLKS